MERERGLNNQIENFREQPESATKNVEGKTFKIYQSVAELNMEISDGNFVRIRFFGVVIKKLPPKTGVGNGYYDMIPASDSDHFDGIVYKSTKYRINMNYYDPNHQGVPEPDFWFTIDNENIGNFKIELVN